MHAPLNWVYASCPGRFVLSGAAEAINTPVNWRKYISNPAKTINTQAN